MKAVTSGIREGKREPPARPRRTAAGGVRRRDGRRPSIYDVARRAGVSIATVSRSLARNPSVAPATDRRIRECMTALGFRPNALARSLASNVKRSIGLIIAGGTREYAGLFLAELLAGIAAGAATEGWSVHLTMLPDRGDEAITALLDRHLELVDGSLVLDIAADSPAVRALLKSGHPAVLLNRVAPVAGVAIDNENGARIAAEHLLALGHRRIACLVSSDPIGRERKTGYRRALQAAGLKAHAMIDCDFKFEQARAATDRLLAARTRPDAILAASDWMALGVLEAARRRGITVPDDLSVVGFDDAIVAGVASPPLTTVRQPLDLLGRTAFETLKRFIATGRAEKTISLEPTLVIRESTRQKSERETVTRDTGKREGDGRK